MCIDQYKILSSRLKYYRISEKFTQRYVAERLNVSRQTYCHYEAGISVPDLNILFKLAELYSIPVENFFNNSTLDTAIINYIDNSRGSYSLFIQYFNNTKNALKYNSLSREEKELIFYFNNLDKTSKHELLLHIYLKTLLASGSNKKLNNNECC